MSLSHSTFCVPFVAAHERRVASFDPQLRLLLQSHHGARLKLNRLGFLQKAVRRFEVAFSEGRISGLDIRPSDSASSRRKIWPNQSTHLRLLAAISVGLAVAAGIPR
jgi:hypothetical protein